MLIFDIETDGIEATKVHCLIAVDLDGNVVIDAVESDMLSAIERLSQEDFLVGHNILGYDLRVLERLYGFSWPLEKTIDTYIKGRFLNRDSYSLDSWGQFLGNQKGGQPKDWSVWTQEMHDYCKQDCKVTLDLYKFLIKQPDYKRAEDCEKSFRAIMNKMEDRGICFDENAANDFLLWCLNEKERILSEIHSIIPPRVKFIDNCVPKATRGAMTKDCPYTKIEVVEFNPSSDDQVREHLERRYSWVGRVKTESGAFSTKAEVLERLSYPEAKLVLDYRALIKVIGYVSSGKESWMNHVKSGRIYGKVNSIGAYTYRCTHSKPNMAQIPKGGDMGHRCRALFRATPGMTMVGCDIKSLEWAILAHYLAQWDGGEFARMVESGTEADGTDIHSNAAKILGVDRPTAKSFMYALPYGAKGPKLASMIYPQETSYSKLKVIGDRLRAEFMAKMPAFDKLFSTLEYVVRTRGYLIGIDGRPLYVPQGVSPVSTLGQGNGAIFAKHALITINGLASSLTEPWYLLTNPHDEWQFETVPEQAERLASVAVMGIETASKNLGLKCHLTGSAKIGINWSQTH